MRVLYDSWKEYLSGKNKAGSDPVVMPWLFSKPFRKQHPERVREIKAKLAEGYLSRDSKAFERQLKANVSHDFRNCLDQISAPTLILVGGHDELTPPRMAQDLKSGIPHARLQVLEGGGHGLYWEIPEEFNKTVLDFLLPLT